MSSRQADAFKEETKKIKSLLKETSQAARGVANNETSETELVSAHSALRNAKRIWSQIPSLMRNQYCYDSLTKFEKHLLDLENLEQVIHFVQNQQNKSTTRKRRKANGGVEKQQVVQLVNSEDEKSEKEESISEIIVTVLPKEEEEEKDNREDDVDEKSRGKEKSTSLKKNKSTSTKKKTPITEKSRGKSVMRTDILSENRHLLRKVELLESLLWSRQKKIIH